MNHLLRIMVGYIICIRKTRLVRQTSGIQAVAVQQDWMGVHWPFAGQLQVWERHALWNSVRKVSVSIRQATGQVGFPLCHVEVRAPHLSIFHVRLLRFEANFRRI